MLRRDGDIVVTARADLALPWVDHRADPNGYYLALGLDPDHAWTMWQIRAAFVKTARECHSDTGDGDVDRFMSVMTAFQVIGNPVHRTLYDQRETPMMDATQRRRARSVTDVITRLGEGTPAAQRIIEWLANSASEEVEEEVDEVPVERMLRVYLDDWVTPPPQVERLAWASLLAAQMHDLGYRDEVLFGFTTGLPRVEGFRWGIVIMVPIGIEPDPSMALWLSIEALARMREGT